MQRSVSHWHWAALRVACPCLCGAGYSSMEMRKLQEWLGASLRHLRATATWRDATGAELARRCGHEPSITRKLGNRRYKKSDACRIHSYFHSRCINLANLSVAPTEIITDIKKNLVYNKTFFVSFPQEFPFFLRQEIFPLRKKKNIVPSKNILGAVKFCFVTIARNIFLASTNISESGVYLNL